jgi:signal transduction histidine kinase
VFEPNRERLQSCNEEVARLAGLAGDLTTLSCLELGGAYGAAANLNKGIFDLAVLLRATAEQFRAAADEKGVELCLNLCECPINASYDRLKQVFINLLANALKYTDAGCISIGVCELSADSGARGAEGCPRWEVTVADTGSGIAEDDIQHIFERFYRADKSRSRSTGGAGVGLTIAAAIVHAHGGSISAKSAGPGRGSTFHVFL